MTALIVAVKGGYTHSVKEILKRNPNVNLTDKDGNTALMIASKEGHTDIVQDLLDAGTYVNIPDRVGAAGLSDAEGGGFTSHPLPSSFPLQGLVRRCGCSFLQVLPSERGLCAEFSGKAVVLYVLT